MFPFINLFFMFVSAWVAVYPKFRTGNPKKDWFIFRINLVAVAINAFAVLYWLFNWITA